MYSMVLMAAMTTGTATPDFGLRGRGCCGCSGSYAGCSGSYAGCYGSSYGGCYGSSYGGCYGSSYGGCYGSSYGSSYGGCYGTSCYGAYYGGCYGLGTSWAGPAYGCTGGVPVMPPAVGVEKVVVPPGDQAKAAPDRARLVVELPADAKLYIDDQLMKTTSDLRTFNTPTLDKGQTYYYIVRAELMRDGKPISESKRVLIRAGEVVRTDFNSMDVTSTAKAR